MAGRVLRGDYRIFWARVTACNVNNANHSLRGLEKMKALKSFDEIRFIPSDGAASGQRLHFGINIRT
jgi:hypothetical protein